MKDQTVVSTRIDKEIKNRLEEISKSSGYPTISEYLRAQLSALSEQETHVNDPSTSSLKPIGPDSCPLLRTFSKLRCSNCVFRKQMKEIQDPGPPEKSGT
jgi:hypothetical protein